MSAGRKNNADKKDWNTPPKYIEPIKEFFGGSIDLDPCSNSHSLVSAQTNFIFPERDGLEESWIGRTIFVNPPYGREGGKGLYHWLEKGLQEYNKGNCKEIVFLIPVATNTRHFKSIIFPLFSCICFLADTRLKFYNEGIEDKKGAPMACCLCYVGNRVDEFERIFKEYGAVWRMRCGGEEKKYEKQIQQTTCAKRRQ